MTKKKWGPGRTHIVMSDGLDTHDPIDYDAKNAPNASEHERFREYYEAKFLEIMDERDAFVKQLLKDHAVGSLTVEGLQKLLISAPEMGLYYAAKYMLHRKLVDHFREQGHALSADREIYLLGKTWADAHFMVKYRGHAQHGRDSSAKLLHGRIQRNADASFEARQRYAEWQHIANDIWRRRPDLSKEAVAAQIKRQDLAIAAKPGTIAKKIERPK
ncbi:MAG: hypothetical protein ACU0B1_13870 [Thermohalobaculum sp.]